MHEPHFPVFFRKHFFHGEKVTLSVVYIALSYFKEKILFLTRYCSPRGNIAVKRSLIYVKRFNMLTDNLLTRILRFFT